MKAHLWYFYCKWAFFILAEDTLERGGGSMQLFRIAVILVFVVFCAVPAIAAEKRFSVPIGDSPSIGPENARVTMIEFLDFQ